MNYYTCSLTDVPTMFDEQYDLIALKIGYEIMYIMLVVYTFKFTFVYIS